MAKVKTHTLSESLARELPGVVRAVKGRGPSTGITPYESGSLSYWARVKSSTISANYNQWVYTVDLYQSPLASLPFAEDLDAANAWELGNGEDEYGGYDPSDAAIIGLLPAPNGKFYQVLFTAPKSEGFASLNEGRVLFYFNHKNDPLIQCDSGE